MKQILLLFFIALSSIAFAQEDATLTFTVQPQHKCLQKDETCTLTCTAECGTSSVLYCWYSTDEKGTTKTPISSDWTTTSDLEIEPFTEKGIRYYVCGATIDQTNIIYSDIVAAAYSGLPIMYIETVEHEEPTAEPIYKDDGRVLTLTNETKVPGSMQIVKDGSIIYNSGEYIEKKSGLTIKLRGNSSFNGEKKPYKIKLQKKADLLADILNRNNPDFKDKEWVLLKGATELNTLLGTNVSDYVGSEWSPKSTFINVIMNGDYRGVYILIEAVKQGEKRINISDNGYIIERDAYYAYEDWYFKTDLVGNHFTFKYPDEDDLQKDATLVAFIKEYMDMVETQIKNGTYEDYIDVESFARWQLAHDILGTLDGWGSNIYMCKYDQSSPTNPYEDGSWSKIKMSALWDFDTIFKMYGEWAKNHGQNINYTNYLFASENSAFWDSYQTLWNNISSTLWTSLSAKLSELKNQWGEDINISRMLDACKWNTSYTTIESNISEAETWFTTRIEWLNTKINHTLIPDFTTLNIKTQKYYDGSATVKITGNISIHNASYINEGDDVSIKITSQYYKGTTTAATTIVVKFALEGRDKDKYELPYTYKEFSGTILPKEVVSGALTLITDQDGTRAEIDGSSNDELNITSELNVTKLTYNRTFEGGRASTIMLPFDFDASEVDGKFYTLANYEWNGNEATITMSEPITELKANTPYIFKPNQTIENIVFDRKVTLKPTTIQKNGIPEWKLVGVYNKKVWETNSSNEYGFAGTDDPDNNITAGEFVKAGVGASIKATRCYLQHVKISKSTDNLPDRIIVLFPDGSASVIEPEEMEDVIEQKQNEDETEDILTPIAEVHTSNNTKVWSYDKTIFIESSMPKNYQIIDLSGRLLKKAIMQGNREEISLNRNNSGVVIVRIDNKSYKVTY